MTVDKNTVEKILTDAHAAVEAAQIPEDLRMLAFGKAIDLLAGALVPSPSGGKEEDSKGGHKAEDGDARLARIARRIGVDVSKLAYIYDLDADDVTLVVSRSKLSSDKASATREVALLYCAARQEGGYDETHTSVAEIRRRAEDMGVLDASNFAAHVRHTEGLTSRGPTAQSRESKVTQHGYEEAGKLVTRLTGGGS